MFGPRPGATEVAALRTTYVGPNFSSARALARLKSRPAYDVRWAELQFGPRPCATEVAPTYDIRGAELQFGPRLGATGVAPCVTTLRGPNFSSARALARLKSRPAYDVCGAELQFGPRLWRD